MLKSNRKSLILNYIDVFAVFAVIVLAIILVLNFSQKAKTFVEAKSPTIIKTQE